jgi:hypothetical protein
MVHRSLRMLAEKVACLRELQKQAESVPIGTDSVGTRLSLIHESLGEKTFEQEGERRSRFHIRFSQCSFRTRLEVRRVPRLDMKKKDASRPAKNRS